MAKKDRFPDGYSSELPNNGGLEGSGCSGRDHIEMSVNENSGGYRKKWIKLSSGLNDGFGVPIRSVPMSRLPSSEKQKWLLRLRSELDQVRTFQDRVGADRAHVAMSSSSNIISCSNVQGNQVNTRKLIDPPQAQKESSSNRRVVGRIQSVKELVVAAEGFSLILRKQCENLLKKLMTHQHGWVFNKPVDVVALKIPDYFKVITKPMDLGTVKEKLCSGKYASPFQFLADVRLTFSNAMTYNPPGNDVHIMADVVSKFFELRWKPIEKKLSLSVPQQKPVHEDMDLVKLTPMSKKRKASPIQTIPLPEPAKVLMMTNDEKLNLSKALETHLADLPDNIIEFLRKHGSNKNEAGEDEIEIDIDVLNVETLFELRKMLDDHVREKQNHAKAEPCVIELMNESGLSNSTMQLYKDEDAEMAGNEPPVSSYPPVQSNKETDNDNNNDENNNHDNKLAISGASSDSGTSHLSESKLKDVSESKLRDVKASSSFTTAQEIDIAGAEFGQNTGPNCSVENRSVSASDYPEQISLQKPVSIESDSQKDEGNSAPSERQVSPDKLYRAAVLKKRFLDTILKAQEKTFNQDEKADPEKLRREKEQLETQKKKEKARLQAEAKAAEDARRRAEAEAAAEAKRKRDLEREAARQALLKMEKTVEIDETSRFLKDLDMLRAAEPEPLLPSCLDETSPEHDSQDGLGSFKFGASNALEQLGLYMKRDEHEEEEETEFNPANNTLEQLGLYMNMDVHEETKLEPASAVTDGHATAIDNDVEEGEIN
ncbi:transcription factor GTE11-like isoform X2 [Rutidosis leptorrhynchoides]|uniref:transcription factor GTE11-like isoform X2 n=1 Tax=Rutidosis leptorrhynchoides TaxID=125765 RepID=UPI003A991DE6